MILNSAQPDFCYWNTPLIELAGKKIGIVGFGNTGQATAQIAEALGHTSPSCCAHQTVSLPCCLTCVLSIHSTPLSIAF